MRCTTGLMIAIYAVFHAAAGAIALRVVAAKPMRRVAWIGSLRGLVAAATGFGFVKFAAIIDLLNSPTSLRVVHPAWQATHAISLVTACHCYIAALRYGEWVATFRLAKIAKGPRATPIASGITLGTDLCFVMTLIATPPLLCRWV